MINEYKVECRFNKSVIELSGGFDHGMGDPLRDPTKKIINLEDDAVRKALIKLGWTPPCDK